MAEQRIVQTGIEYERDIRREQAVVGLGQAQFAGHYSAQAHMTGERHKVAGPIPTTTVQA